MSDLRELYQQVILDHNRSPRNYRCISEADRSSEGHNPLCGDHLSLYVKLDGGRIADIAFQGAGCAISKASASLMTDAVKGQTIREAQLLFGKFRDLVTSDISTEPVVDGIGKLAVFAGVREFPVRIKCATLAWHTLEAALENSEFPVTTE
ncbi:MAG: SUF system NifU family Fe-S cluster assembly protein [Candidatus Latescibacteria bacterium]|nr:SUF system NifU family Fe-S cluster assembly protein [Candidatus Latescibacterota bacterium]